MTEEDTAPESALDTLPQDMLREILALLPRIDAVAFGATSKEHHALAAEALRTRKTRETLYDRFLFSLSKMVASYQVIFTRLNICVTYQFIDPEYGNEILVDSCAKIQECQITEFSHMYPSDTESEEEEGHVARSYDSNDILTVCLQTSVQCFPKWNIEFCFQFEHMDIDEFMERYDPDVFYRWTHEDDRLRACCATLAAWYCHARDVLDGRLYNERNAWYFPDPNNFEELPALREFAKIAFPFVEAFVREPPASPRTPKADA